MTGATSLDQCSLLQASDAGEILGQSPGPPIALEGGEACGFAAADTNRFAWSVSDGGSFDAPPDIQPVIVQVSEGAAAWLPAATADGQGPQIQLEVGGYLVIVELSIEIATDDPGARAAAFKIARLLLAALDMTLPEDLERALDDAVDGTSDSPHSPAPVESTDVASFPPEDDVLPSVDCMDPEEYESLRAIMGGERLSQAERTRVIEALQAYRFTGRSENAWMEIAVRFLRSPRRVNQFDRDILLVQFASGQIQIAMCG